MYSTSASNDNSMEPTLTSSIVNHQLQNYHHHHQPDTLTINNSGNGSGSGGVDGDDYEVLRKNCPWPRRNHACFLNLNVFMERCNDVLELVQTMRHFRILSKTVALGGGSDNHNMDLISQQIHERYERALADFKSSVTDVMSFESERGKSFETSFFHLRSTIKVSALSYYKLLSS